MDDAELALALLEIVAILLPLGLIALGLVPRWLAFDEQEILGVSQTIAFGAVAGLSLLLLSFSGAALLVFLYGETRSVTIEAGMILLGGTFALMGAIGTGLVIAFQIEQESREREVDSAGES